MASVAVVTSSPPNVDGGHLVIAHALIAALGAQGHTASLVTTPECNFGYQASSYLDTWRTDVATVAGRRIDQVISLRFPSYAVRHDRHVCWLNHTMREYYDLWPRFSSSISARARLKEQVKKRVIHAADWWLLKHNVSVLMAISSTVQRRLERTLGVSSGVLWPPAPPRPYRCDRYGDYIFAVSRITPLKRLDLLIRALAEPPARHIRAVIAGEGESRPELEALAERLNVRPRIEFIGRIGDATLVKHLASCRAVCFTPYDEDYGFVTVEAFASGKPVVTCSDSGGPIELVRHEDTGLVTEPSAAAVAGALVRLMDDAALAEALGARGRRQSDMMTWGSVVDRLLIV